MLETDTKKITRTWREMLKTVLAKSKQLTSLQQSKIKKKWPEDLGGLPKHKWPNKG